MDTNSSFKKIVFRLDFIVCDAEKYVTSTASSTFLSVCYYIEMQLIHYAVQHTSLPFNSSSGTGSYVYYATTTTTRTIVHSALNVNSVYFIEQI